MIKVQVTDSGVIDAFNRLIALGEHPQGALESIGEVVEEFTKQRFQLSKDPYGETWAVNSDVTLQVLLNKNLSSSSKKNFKKDGSLSKSGTTYKVNYLASKKPLIESKQLSTRFHWSVIGDEMVTVTSAMEYAAIQQFGAKQGEFGRDKRNHPLPWGDIPARPFFPDVDRGLPDELSQAISDVLRDAIQGAIDG